MAKISVPSSNFKIAHFTLYFYKGIVLKIRGQDGLFSAFTIDMVRKSSFFWVLIFYPPRQKIIMRLPNGRRSHIACGNS